MTGDEHAWELLMDKLNGMDSKLDGVAQLVQQHEIAIQNAKTIGKIAHYIGWPSLAAGLHHLWQQLK